MWPALGLMLDSWSRTLAFLRVGLRLPVLLFLFMGGSLLLGIFSPGVRGGGGDCVYEIGWWVLEGKGWPAEVWGLGDGRDW